MLRHYKSIETPRTDGGKTLAITDELVDDPCARCGAESVSNVCEGDGRLHHHGRVHTRAGDLQALCGPCGKVVADEWKRKRTPVAFRL